MGQNSSRKIAELERNQDLLMKQNAELAKHIAEQGEFHKKQHEATVEQMAKLLVVLMQSNANETVIKNDRKSIEIEGVIYDVTQFVNKGGFGQIYKAQVRNSDRVAAIKIMPNSPAIQEEIKNEIKFLRLTKNIEIENHPVIDYYGCKITNEGIFIAMELAFCDLLTFWFNEVAEREQQQKFIFGILIILYVLRALIFLEKLNIIHGDIKPQNLVIVQGNQCFYVKLIDFGTVEKMDTNRAHLTVGMDKAYTLFFASPEFLRRDSNNLVSRRLHKKSDAWAAGVMFYVLFFEKLPWKDQIDYEKFCNNTNEKDIIVPDQGGYKLIIELLLKKNPEQRSSAKDTLMQIKSHPVLKVIVESIEEMFYPVDDVCQMNVPNNIKQELGISLFILFSFHSFLAKLARPGHYANKQEPTTTEASCKLFHLSRLLNQRF
jgi:serine/threonine protein kinase